MNENTALTTSREIARAVLAWPFDPAELARSASREAVVGAIDGFRKAMTPANRLTKGERAEDQKSLRDSLRTIGLRIRPDFAPDQAKMWIAAMVQSMEHMPLRIAILAARDAIHHPLNFPGEVLGVVSELAKPHIARHERALRNLERLLSEIDNPPPVQIEASDEAKTNAEMVGLEELQHMPSELRSLGLTAGFLIENPDNSIRWATDEEQEKRRLTLDVERSNARAAPKS